MDTKAKIGRLLGILAGLTPVMVGCYFYLRTMKGKNWSFWADVFYQGKSDFNWGTDGLYVVSHFGSVNLMATGLTMLCLSAFAIPSRLKWAWWLFTTIVVWVGLNDVVASVWFYRAGGGMFPIPIFPTVFGAVSLLLTREYVFKGQE